MRVYAQARLPTRLGRLSLPCACVSAPVVHLARATASLGYLHAYAGCYQLVGVDLGASSTLPFFDGLRAAADAYARQLGQPEPDLASLLTGTPSSQHDLAAGVYARRTGVVLADQPDDWHRSRVLSTGGAHVGL